MLQHDYRSSIDVPDVGEGVDQARHRRLRSRAPETISDPFHRACVDSSGRGGYHAVGVAARATFSLFFDEHVAILKSDAIGVSRRLGRDPGQNPGSDSDGCSHRANRFYHLGRNPAFDRVPIGNGPNPS